MGYHQNVIREGVFGEYSKMLEECDEFEDAMKQGNLIMVFQELSDILSAMRKFLEPYQLNLTHLETMANLIEKVFKDGTRTPKN